MKSLCSRKAIACFVPAIIAAQAYGQVLLELREPEEPLLLRAESEAFEAVIDSKPVPNMTDGGWDTTIKVDPAGSEGPYEILCTGMASHPRELHFLNPDTLAYVAAFQSAGLGREILLLDVPSFLTYDTVCALWYSFSPCTQWLVYANLMPMHGLDTEEMRSVVALYDTALTGEGNSVAEEGQWRHSPGLPLYPPENKDRMSFDIWLAEDPLFHQSPLLWHPERPQVVFVGTPLAQVGKKDQAQFMRLVVLTCNAEALVYAPDAWSITEVEFSPYDLVEEELFERHPRPETGGAVEFVELEWAPDRKAIIGTLSPAYKAGPWGRWGVEKLTIPLP